MNVMKAESQFRPVVPPLAPPENIFIRLFTARVLADVRNQPIADVIRETWPQDLVVIRAATAPAMTTVTGWAAELAARVVADGLEVLGTVSAGAQLLREGLVLSWNGNRLIGVPGFTADANTASFVAEGEPIPVRALAITPGTLLPYKLAVVGVLTQEMIDSSNAEQLVGDVFVRSMGLALDAALFDANPVTAARPAGLRNGIAALTPSATVGSDGISEDMATLLNAIAPVAGAGPYFIIAGPGRAVSAQVRLFGNEFVTFLPSAAVGNDIIAVAPAALATAIGTEPTIETSRAASLHMDTAPQPVGTVGPHKSMFQTYSIALKTRWPVSWALRDPRGVAWLTPSWK